MKEPSWVQVYQSSDEYMITIQKLKLEDAEIPVMVFNQRDSSYNAFGYIYINVPSEFRAEAEKIVNSENE